MKAHSRFAKARRLLLFWCLFIGIGAVGGSIGMLIAPDGSAMGMQAILPCFQVLPFADALFQDFVFPGIALLCVNGLTNLTAAALILARRRSGIVLGGVFGVTLMLWICIQFCIFEFNFMSTAYFIFGLAQAATGYAAFVFDRQERFHFDPLDYRNIGTNPEELVVYFSRMGYTRKVAYERADALGASLLELRATEPTAGTGGFWWCGRYGMHGWDMPIEPVTAALEDYSRVTVCSPVWVFGLAGPVRSFCKAAAGRVKRADCVLVHHTAMRYRSAAQQLFALLGVAPGRVSSVQCRMGRFREKE